MKLSDLQEARDLGMPADAIGENPAPRAASSSLLNQLHKTKMCAFHRSGECRYGSECSWAHSEEELKILPDLRKTRLCAAFQERGRCDDPRCAFAHGEEDLRSTAVFYRKKLCIWNAKGRCRNGDQCRFAHGHRQLAQERQRADAAGAPARARAVAEVHKPPDAGGPLVVPRSASWCRQRRRFAAGPGRAHESLPCGPRLRRRAPGVPHGARRDGEGPNGELSAAPGVPLPPALRARPAVRPSAPSRSHSRMRGPRWRPRRRRVLINLRPGRRLWRAGRY